MTKRQIRSSTVPKPAFLDSRFGEQFCDASVVSAYHHRPPYPDEVLAILCSFVVPPGVVLDVGTGTGEIARGLAGRGQEVDAVDPSVGMLAKGRELPGGGAPGLHWILGRAEEAPLRSAYGLITAAASLHWMDWQVVLPRFKDLLTPGGVLAIVDLLVQPTPWEEQLRTTIARYSTNQEFRAYNLIAELEQRSLFRQLGQRHTDAVPFSQPLDAYIESFHARNGFSRNRMTLAEAEAFDLSVGEMASPHLINNEVLLMISGNVVWGQPAPPRDRRNVSR